MSGVGRDDIRSAIFSTAKFKSEEIDFFGQKVEIRQPSVDQLRKLSDLYAKKDKNAVVQLIIEYTYIPGSDTKVFDQADYDQLKNLPSGDWLISYQKVWSKLAGINEEEIEKN